MSSYEVAIKQFPRVRQSRLSQFDRCALSSYFDEKYRKDWSGHPQARGQIFHRTAALALQVMSEHQESRIETDVILEILFDVLRQDEIDKECPVCLKEIVDRVDGRIVCVDGHVSASDFVNIPTSEVKDLRWEVIKFATDNTFDIANLVDVEHRLSAEVAYPDPNGFPVVRVLTGQLDALFVAGSDDEEAIVLDYKSSWDLPAASDVGFEGYFQQRFYAFLVLVNYPAIEKVTLREHYTRYSEFREATVYRHELDYVKQELAALTERFDRAYSERNFPASPGRHCQMCAMPAKCPIFPDVRVTGMITDDVTARKIAAEANVARAALKHRDLAMKAWSSVHGDVPITSTPGRERSWGYVTRKRVSRPKREDLERAMYVNGSNVDLDELYVENTVTRFEQHRPVPEDPVAVDAQIMQALEASVKQQQGSES